MEFIFLESKLFLRFINNRQLLIECTDQKVLNKLQSNPEDFAATVKKKKKKWRL